ncbi:MerR family transcriptional regulator [Lacrimispora saccharolytica]|uniref:Transcriptional regulator, MerR family n=1 Tax=Lacrimispora saccharolytica (strain ATCC 35040 / DSM 2544 / NRCC 2533 / WM1) TaxID=610130 RepID=D9R8X7_LACSW|nr:MerR family transcriptional regulator [Lacrimispora saccharolytica]ADL03952.1 transcriptional regulator, MerR family [[Clostridium] saccharolyticum WM1]QRV21740.1 MerR family transcriptional regulator [Lacrimispora saccharolytica]
MKKYSIGEVSNRLGLSRDTLRFYEKKGIIQPEKQKNGYRTYTYEDIKKLSSIMFYRRLNFSIEDIGRILYKSSFPSYCSMIQEKIAEEKLQVEKHRQSLIHLTHLQKHYKNVEKFLNRYDLRPMPPYYQMPDNHFINQTGIADLCYICQEYRIQDHGADRGKEFFMIAEDTASIMKLKQALNSYPLLKQDRCVYTVVASDSLVLESQAVLNAADWARKHGFHSMGLAYSSHLLSCAFKDIAKENQDIKADTPIHYMEVYLPLQE